MNRPAPIRGDADAPEDRLPLLRNRNFKLIWLAYGISALGDHLSEMALLKMQDALNPAVADTTRRQAVMMFAFMFPFFALGPVFGWVADRLPRRGVMIAADLIRALIIVEAFDIFTTLQHRLDPAASPESPITAGVAVMPLVLLGVFAAMFSPARSSLLPTLIRSDQLVRANSLTAGLGMISTIAAAVIGGWIVTHYEAVWSFRLNAITFLVSAACILAIRTTYTKSPRTDTTDDGLRAIRNGFRYVLSHRRITQIIGMSAIMWTAAAIIRSIIPAMIKEVTSGTYQDVGEFQALLGLGIVAGSVVLALVGPALPSTTAMCWGMTLAGLSGGLLTCAVTARWQAPFIAAGLVGVGFFGAGILVSVSSLLQRLTPNHIRGRVFGVHDLCTMSGLLLVTGLLGIPEWKNVDRYITPIMAVVSVALLLTGLVATNRRLRRSPFGMQLAIWKNIHDVYLHLWARARRDGICTIPPTGPVIVAANHNSTLDPFLLIATSPHRMPSFMIAREYARLLFFRYFAKLSRCIPVNRTGIDTASVKGALRHLEQGRVLGIFPQGGVRPPGETDRIRDGVGLLALRSGAVVIPAYVSGVRYSDAVVWPFFMRHHATVRYGAPVDLSRWRGREKDREAYREIAEEVMRRVWALRER